MSLSPFFNVVECEAVSIGTLFHPGATLKLGEGGKFRKYSKVPIYFVQGCSIYRTKRVFFFYLALSVIKHKTRDNAQHRQEILVFEMVKTVH